jgi:NADP-dependent 3-hydroxy acid dehydrogenase YdfG
VVALVRRADSLDDAEAIVGAAVEAFGTVDMLAVAAGPNRGGFIHEQSLEGAPTAAASASGRRARRRRCVPT